MIRLDVLFGDGQFQDWKDKKITHIKDAAVRVAVLDKGMTSGKPSVAVGIELPDGQVVIFETSARLFCTAGLAIQARHPGLLDEPIRTVGGKQ